MRALYAIFSNEDLQDLFGLEPLKVITPTRVSWTIRGPHEDADSLEDSGELFLLSSSLRATVGILEIAR